MKKLTEKANSEMIQSSGNVFADLGLPDAEELNTRARLGAALIEIVRKEGFSQADVGGKLLLSQPKVSALLNHKLEGFSVERLMQYLASLGYEVLINVHPVDVCEKAAVKVRCAAFDISGSASVIRHASPASRFSKAVSDYASAFGLTEASTPTLLPRIA
jgi:predicted XRE-type DNA-binding protein